MGITTFAPARIPLSRPPAAAVPSAVVAGSKISGHSSRLNASIFSVVCTEPPPKSLNGVSLCGRKGPIPAICGLNCVKNASSSASISVV